MTRGIVDLTSEEPGCNDNPISRLIKTLKEGSDSVLIKIRKTYLPISFARIFAERYGYDVLLISEDENTYLLEFRRQTSR